MYPPISSSYWLFRFATCVPHGPWNFIPVRLFQFEFCRVLLLNLFGSPASSPETPFLHPSFPPFSLPGHTHVSGLSVVKDSSRTRPLQPSLYFILFFLKDFISILLYCSDNKWEVLMDFFRSEIINAPTNTSLDWFSSCKKQMSSQQLPTLYQRPTHFLSSF